MSFPFHFLAFCQISIPCYVSFSYFIRSNSAVFVLRSLHLLIVHQEMLLEKWRQAVSVSAAFLFPPVIEEVFISGTPFKWETAITLGSSVPHLIEAGRWVIQLSRENLQQNQEEKDKKREMLYVDELESQREYWNSITDSPATTV